MKPVKPYKMPKGYLDWKVFKEHSEVFQKVTPKPINIYGMPQILENLAYMFDLWSSGYPLYCVRPELLESMLETDVGEKLELFVDIKLSVPSYVLFFPKNKVNSPTNNGYIDYLVINHQELNFEEHKHVITWGCVDSEHCLIFSSKRIRRDGTLQRSHFETDDKQQQDNALTLRNIVLQSVLLLQYYSEIERQMEVSELTTPLKGFGKQQNFHESKFQLPRWLGNNIKTKSVSNGVGVSKSTHFRRGFWRCQPCGSGRQDRDIIWIQPTWVNPGFEK